MSTLKNTIECHSQTLCVFVRGWTNEDDWISKLSGNKSGDFPKGFISFVKNQLPGADFLLPEELGLDMSLLSTKRPRELSERILKTVGERFDAQKHKQILFIAFSSGAPLTRYALLRAFGVTENGRVDKSNTEAWGDGSVQVRAVYLAGILRGWRYTTAMPTHIRFLAVPLAVVTNGICLIKDRRTSFIFELKHDSEFILQSRLMQLALRNAGNHDTLPYEQVSVLGTRDEFISPADCIEVSGSGSTVFVEISSTNHLDMLSVEEDGVKERQEKISVAISKTMGQMSEIPGYVVPLDDIDDYFDDLDRPRTERATKLNRDVKSAVVILHGIRDNGFWTKRVARQLKEKADRPLLRAPSPSYGFFSLLDFARRKKRRMQARWLVEQFIDVRDCYPNAEINFVGHSNGTYLVKAALEDFPALKLNRLVLAGSVIRTDFAWGSVSEQISGGVLNLTGTRDAVIACLPGALERLGLNAFDVGGAGFHGFKNADDADEVRKDPEKYDFFVVNKRVQGDHGAGISERGWQTIQDFIVFGSVPSFEDAKRTISERKIEQYGHFVFPAIFAIFIFAFGCGFWVLMDNQNPVLLIVLLGLLWLLNKIIREA